LERKSHFPHFHGAFLNDPCQIWRASFMHRLNLARFSAALLFSFVFAFARAEETRPDARHPAAAGAGPASELPADAVTQHTIALGGQQLSYTATAGTLPLTGPKGEVAARIFYVSYTANAGNPRPVTFAFNGGPGAAAAFLHLGALGPRIVPFKNNGASPILPVQLADNPDSWLAFTDLVFIDPVGTGFSRATAGGADAEKAYWNVDKDIASLADAVRLYLSRNGRQLSPVYLAGESYGGFRAAQLSDRLLAMGFQLQGAVMISPALEFSMIRGDDYSILPLTFALPALTAANGELRGGLDAPLDSVREAETFSRTSYLVHLAEGLKRDDAIVSALSKFTGLSPEIVARQHGRVPTEVFLRDYLQQNGRVLSRYDAAISVPVPRPSKRYRFDPILDGAIAVLAPAASSYIDKELGFHTTLEYRLLNREVSGHWDFGLKPGQQGYAGSLEELEKARVHNPELKIFIAHGYTDLVTPYSASRFLISQLRPIDGAAPIEIRVYRGGHMMYLRPASRANFTGDVRGMFGAASAH
jgi:carboxypeptidase C (cathepsin A)